MLTPPQSPARWYAAAFVLPLALTLAWAVSRYPLSMVVRVCLLGYTS